MRRPHPIFSDFRSPPALHHPETRGLSKNSLLILIVRSSAAVLSIRGLDLPIGQVIPEASTATISVADRVPDPGTFLFLLPVSESRSW